MMHDLPFVDAHVHLWDLKRIHYPWLTPPFGSDGPNGSVEAIARDYLLDDLPRVSAKISGPGFAFHSPEYWSLAG